MGSNALAFSKTRLAVGDFDGDGRIDVIVNDTSGSTSSNYCGLWRNAGMGHFTELNDSLTGGQTVDVINVVDYDGDSLPDLLLTLPTAAGGRELRLLHNDGAGQFRYVQVWFGSPTMSAASSDLDNNGTLDLLLTGNAAFFGTRTVLWRNTGSRFEPLVSALDSYTNAFAAVWLDADGDGDSDAYLSRSSPPVQIFWNLLAATNTPPSPPGPLALTLSDDLVRLSWGAASDAQSPPPWLTYSVRIGTMPGGSDIVAPSRGSAGNAGNQRAFTFKPVPGRTYYASVQGVDSQYIAGLWSQELTMRFDLVRTLGGGGPVPGDTNNDGVVSLDELNAVIQAYRGLRF